MMGLECPEHGDQFSLAFGKVNIGLEKEITTMHKETLTTTGTAWLVGGDEKATTALIKAVADQKPKDKRDATRMALSAALSEEFKVTHEEDIPDTLDEALAMLGWTHDEWLQNATKKAMDKAVTNKRDKARIKRAKEIVEQSDISAKIGMALTK